MLDATPCPWPGNGGPVLILWAIINLSNLNAIQVSLDGIPSQPFQEPFLLKLNIKQQQQHQQQQQQKKRYLKVYVDESLPVGLYLSELWPQSFDLALLTHDVLKVPLCPQVQHLDWLRHVLHLWKRMNQSSIDFPVCRQIKMSSCSAAQPPAMLQLSKEQINILTSNVIVF